MGERLGGGDLAQAQEIRVFDVAPGGDHLTGQPPVKQRQLGIDTRGRALEAARAGNAKGDPLGEHEIQHSILQPGATDRRPERGLDGAHIHIARDALVSRRLDAKYVRGRDLPGGDVVVRNPLRLGARGVDDHRDVLGGLGTDRARDDDDEGQGDPPDLMAGRLVRFAHDSHASLDGSTPASASAPSSKRPRPEASNPPPRPVATSSHLIPVDIQCAAVGGRADDVQVAVPIEIS